MVKYDFANRRRNGRLLCGVLRAPTGRCLELTAESERGAAACPINTICDPEAAGRGCLPKPCAVDSDCDCGVCMHHCSDLDCPPGPRTQTASTCAICPFPSGGLCGGSRRLGRPRDRGGGPGPGCTPRQAQRARARISARVLSALMCTRGISQVEIPMARARLTFALPRTYRDTTRLTVTKDAPGARHGGSLK
jgi:hypothetical protein